MEKVQAYVYNLTEDKAMVKLAVANVIPMEPTKPLKEQKAVRIKGFRIDDFKKVYKKFTWYATDATLILPDRADEEAFWYFRSVLEKRSRKAIDELIIAEEILDVFCKNYNKGCLIIEKEQQAGELNELYEIKAELMKVESEQKKSQNMEIINDLFSQNREKH